jgi:protein-tyrosine kinase
MSTSIAWPGLPGEVGLLDEGVVAPSKPCEIIASLRDPHSIVGEELRLLRSRLRRNDSGGAARRLAVTSALPSEGKSTLALGLAAAFARESGRKVLLIEADLRRPTVSRNLGLPPAAGLGEWLEGAIERVPVRRVETAGFSVVVAGERGLERPEGLSSPPMDALLRAACGAFDEVILDVPPILPVADAVLMQDLVDGFLLVVRSRVTPREAILDALGRLRPEKIVGIVLNAHRDYRHSYSKYAYDRYGMRYGEQPSKGGNGGDQQPPGPQA